MSDPQTTIALLTEQRDRFVAFAFAAAEVLLEVNGEGRINFVAGGVKALLGLQPSTLSGRSLQELAVPGDRFLVGEHLVRLQQSTRAADMIVGFEVADGKPLPALVSGMKSPQRDDVFHITLRHLPLVARGTDRQILVSPIAIQDFCTAASDMGRQAAQAEEKPKLALYEIDLGLLRDKQGAEAAEQVETDLVQSMRAWAAGSSAVGRAGQGRYSLLMDEYSDPAVLARRLREVAKARGAEVEVGSTVLDISDALEDESLSLMLGSALRRFEAEGLESVSKGTLRDLVVPSAGRKGGAGVVMNAKRKGTKESWG